MLPTLNPLSPSEIEALLNAARDGMARVKELIAQDNQANKCSVDTQAIGSVEAAARDSENLIGKPASTRPT